MRVYPGLPPYTDTSGRGKIRVGKDCQPLTGALRRRIMVETGEPDYTATEIPGSPDAHISAAAMAASSFRIFVAEEAQKGRSLSVDHLLIPHYLRDRSEKMKDVQ